MSEENQGAPRPQRSEGQRSEGHPLAPNQEQHLQEAHNLAIQPQGKEGAMGRAVWALVKEERGKVKTLAVHRGTKREAVTHFYAYIHPAGSTPPPAPARRGGGGSRPAPRQQDRRSSGGGRPGPGGGRPRT